MMKKRLKISKKIYVSPLVEFEEIEQDELDMLMISQDDAETPNPPSGPSDPDLPGPPPPAGQSVYDLDFSMDFVINDGPQI